MPFGQSVLADTPTESWIPSVRAVPAKEAEVATITSQKAIEPYDIRVSSTTGKPMKVFLLPNGTLEIRYCNRRLCLASVEDLKKWKVTAESTKKGIISLPKLYSSKTDKPKEWAKLFIQFDNQPRAEEMLLNIYDITDAIKKINEKLGIQTNTDPFDELMAASQSQSKKQKQSTQNK